MKFGIKNIGPIKDCSIALNKLTVLCGENNTGKTYYTYSLCAFLEYLRNTNPYTFSHEERVGFLETGKLIVSVKRLVESYSSIFSSGYMKQFPSYLAKSLAIEDAATSSCIVEATSEIGIHDSIKAFIEAESSKFEMIHASGNKLVVSHDKGSDDIICSYVPTENMGGASPQLYPLEDSVFRHVEWMFLMLIRRHLPRCFCITSERNGVYMFGSELRFFNSILANASIKDFAKYQTLRKRFDFRGYPLPVRQEIDVLLRLDEIQRTRSIFSEEDSLVIKCLNNLVGGTYDVDKSGISFTETSRNVGKGGEIGKIGLNRCSSSVRSLIELDYYVRHIARLSDILIIDEPELDLHPMLQRKFARFITTLVNSGVRVFLTTHSDYLIREINLLVCAWSDDEKERSRRSTELGIDKEAFMSPNIISCYVMDPSCAKQMIFEEGRGFPIESFDENIRQFSRLYSLLHDNICVDDSADEGADHEKRT